MDEVPWHRVEQEGPLWRRCGNRGGWAGMHGQVRGPLAPCAQSAGNHHHGRYNVVYSVTVFLIHPERGNEAQRSAVMLEPCACPMQRAPHEQRAMHYSARGTGWVEGGLLHASNLGGSTSAAFEYLKGAPCAAAARPGGRCAARGGLRSPLDTAGGEGGATELRSLIKGAPRAAAARPGSRAAARGTQQTLCRI